ncbi:DUF2637 domain-containing protein [Streptomyces sp. SL13]|jgi:hypothetical protein|uniref:DUF2637 domain-containing protein n=1 Tax=Streptantibioticus silvisoli TaxID=2705255 RepID=A0AA90H6B1_9ACTN|nr:DUF2637 domain-containing protein [Streptantibioticus silvisoli]MDI5964224.1 DUF2637 domain-containing protein [Streptantibioticus silvisoli]MDI5971710.1 DUF2637 domain-containing protein [Streptantibioticus silvisoli]
MKLTDISLDWTLSGAVGIAVAIVAVIMMLKGRKARAAGASMDSWERGEERRRQKEALYGSASYVLLFCCAGVAAALSFHGLVGFGRENLDLAGGWEYLVPFGLDGAAMFCSVLAVREASHGDAALGSRLLVWTFASASAWFNWVHAPRGFGHAGAPEFFAGMSMSAAVLFDRALKQTRRAALREQGLVPRPLPQIRMVRWIRAPRETYKAWSLMLLENVRTLDEAVEEVRDDQRQQEQTRLARRDHDRMERARIKAISRQHRGWGGRPRGGGRQVELPSAHQSSAASGEVAEPAIGDSTELPAAQQRPALQPVRGERTSVVDLTAEDDTQTLPRLDSLEAKLKDLERQFG